jgi:hippurate hydrolase
MKKQTSVLVIVISLMFVLSARAQDAMRRVVNTFVDVKYPSLFELYTNLHANPELSFQEQKSSARLAEELERAGYAVTTKVGGYGVVAIFTNGPGPTVMVRCL